MLALFDEWPERDDSKYYPVEGWVEAHYGTNKWEHPKRLRLLYYLINEVDKLASRP